MHLTSLNQGFYCSVLLLCRKIANLVDSQCNEIEINNWNKRGVFCRFNFHASYYGYSASFWTCYDFASYKKKRYSHKIDRLSCLPVKTVAGSGGSSSHEPWDLQAGVQNNIRCETLLWTPHLRSRSCGGWISSPGHKVDLDKRGAAVSYTKPRDLTLGRAAHSSLRREWAGQRSGRPNRLCGTWSYDKRWFHRWRRYPTRRSREGSSAAAAVADP